MTVEPQFHCSDYLNTGILAAASTLPVCIHQHYMFAWTHMSISLCNNMFDSVTLVHQLILGSKSIKSFVLQETGWKRNHQPSVWLNLSRQQQYENTMRWQSPSQGIILILILILILIIMLQPCVIWISKNKMWHNLIHGCRPGLARFSTALLQNSSNLIRAVIQASRTNNECVVRFRSGIKALLLHHVNPNFRISASAAFHWLRKSASLRM